MQVDRRIRGFSIRYFSYPRFQLSAVGRDPKKKNWKIKEINGS
jgi:hypothetical protein